MKWPATEDELARAGYGLGATGRCRSCNASIRWAHTPPSKAKPKGSRMPLESADPRPFPGKLFADESAEQTMNSVDRWQAQRFYQSHFATCPNAAAHRRNPKKQRSLF